MVTSFAWSRLTPERLALLADPTTLVGRPVRRAFDAAAEILIGAAKEATPVDTGHLRASIKSRIDASPIPRHATVGTKVKYARAVHDGRPPNPSTPTGAQLETWARRKGLNAYEVAARIRRRGTRGVPFLAEPFARESGRVRDLFDRAAAEIEAAWDGAG